MVQKILIFKICILVFFSLNFSLKAKDIVGKARVIDGDTIHIGINKIRLHGIDSPEMNQKCIYKKIQWQCGKQSAVRLKNLINNKTVKCVTNSIDNYDRYIAKCFINERNLNQIMVKSGWAIAYRYYSKDYIKEEMYARKNKLGIWKGKFEEPYLFRKRTK